MAKKTENAAKSETQVQATSPAPEGTAVSPAKPEAVSAAAKKGKEQELTALTKKIRKDHGKLTVQLKRSSVLARELGEYLIEAKKLVKPGRWTSWLEDHCHLTARQAQKYMRLATHWPELVASGRNPESFSIEQNLALLTNPGATGLNGKGTTSSGTKSSTPAAGRFQVSGKQELKEKLLLADDLLETEPTVFSSDAVVGKLVQDIIASVEQQVCKQVRHLKAKGNDAQEIDPVVLAIAILKKVQDDLNPKAVAKVVEPETKTVEAPEPAAEIFTPHNRLNGPPAVSMAS